MLLDSSPDHAPSAQARSTLPATPLAQLDEAVTALKAQADRFAGLSLRARVDLLEHARTGVLAVAEEWVRAACAAKGLDFESPQAGEEWLAGPMTTVRNIRLLQETLSSLSETGRPPLSEKAVQQRPDGQVTVKVYPNNLMDKLMFAGFEAEVWLDPAVSLEEGRREFGRIYREKSTDGGVALVLGAGNVASIGPMDVFYKMFADNEICILKMNPVNEYLGPILEKALAQWVKEDFFRVVYGGAEQGAHLCQHPDVHSIHITGSHHTHDAIVWGPPGAERERRMEQDEPVCTKPITSELGCVTPVLVVPGPWSDADVDFQAANIATMVANNGSFNCNAAKVVVTSKGWAQRQPLLDRIEGVLKEHGSRKAYYPGAQDRYARFMKAHPDGKQLAPKTDDTVPWTTFFGLDSADQDEICFSTEAFCGVLAETSLDATDPVEFLEQAVEFANERCWGTLSCTLLVHPRTMADPRFAQAMERALANLRFGGIGVNAWPGLIYGLVTTTWGAYPGHSMKDIRSGRGVVHNTFLIDRPQKSVLKAPFRISPKPLWFITHKRTHKAARKLVGLEAAPSFLKLPGVVVNAALG